MYLIGHNSLKHLWQLIEKTKIRITTAFTIRVFIRPFVHRTFSDKQLTRLANNLMHTFIMRLGWILVTLHWDPAVFYLWLFEQ